MEPSKEFKELVANLSSSESAIEQFFDELCFDGASLDLIEAIGKTINGNEAFFASYLLVWFDKNVDSINKCNRKLQEQAIELILLVLKSHEFKEDWIIVHSNSWRLLSNLNFELAQQVFTDGLAGIPRRWLFEPRLTQLFLWLWKQMVHQLPIDFSLRLLKLVLMPCTREQNTSYSYSTPDIKPAFSLKTDLDWYELTQAYGKAEIAIIPHLIQQSPKETLSLLIDILDITVYLERIGDPDSPPNSSTVIYRNSIEDTSQTRNSPTDFISHLLICIRDALTHLENTSPKIWYEEVEKLANGRWYCYQRLAMNALAESNSQRSLKLSIQYIPIWCKEFCSSVRGASSEYHHELWRLLNCRCAEIANSGRAGKKLIRSIALMLESHFGELKKELDKGLFKTNTTKEIYVGQNMRIWLWALEPSLSIEGFEELQERLAFLRANIAQFGENKPSNLFSYYSQGGKVIEKSMVGSEDFLARIDEIGVDSSIEYLIENLPSRNRDDYRDGEIISYNLNPMLKEFASRYPKQVAELLVHENILKIDPDYLASLAYGLHDLAGQLKQGKGKKALLPALLNAIESAFYLRKLIIEKRGVEVKGGDDLHGAFMALSDVANVASKINHKMRIVQIACMAYSSDMFSNSTNEPPATRADGTDTEFSRVEVVAEPEYPLMALFEIIRKVYNLDIKKKGELSRQEIRLKNSTTVALTEVLKSAPSHKTPRHIGQFLGREFFMVFLYSERFDPELLMLARKFFENAYKEREPIFGTSFRYGFLKYGSVHNSNFDLYVPLYNYCITEFEMSNSVEAYGKSLSWHLFVLFCRSRNGLIGDENSSLSEEPNVEEIKKLILRVFKFKIGVYDTLKRQLLFAPTRIPNEFTAKAWKNILIPFWELAVEGLGSSSGSYSALSFWAQCLPNDLSLIRDIGAQKSPMSIIKEGILSTNEDSFQGHSIGHLVQTLMKRLEAKPRDLASICEIIKAVLLLCVKVRKSDKKIYLPIWELEKAWKLVGIVEARKKPIQEPLKGHITGIKSLLVMLKISKPGK